MRDQELNEPSLDLETPATPGDRRETRMEPRSVEAIYPLSPIQHGILFHGIYRREPGQYSSQLTCALDGDLDIAALEQVWRQLVRRHAIFRTAFLWEGLDDPVQVVLREVELPIELHDLRHLDPLAQSQEIERLQEEDRLRGFEFTRAPLMRLTLFRLDERRHRLLWSFHHLIMDGWSEALVTAELSRLYLSLSTNEVPKLGPCRDYGAYLEWLSRQDLAQAEAFWRRALAGFTAPTPLAPGARTQRERAAGGGDWRCLQHQPPAELGPLLRELARRNRLTLSILVQGAWSLLLGQSSGQRDVVFGLTVSGRPADLLGVEWIVGPFINTLPMRVRIAPEEGILPWLRQIQDQQVELRRYEFSPLVEVQRWSEIPRGQPLFESILVFQNGPAALDSTLDAQPAAPGLAVGQIAFRGGWTNYPLSLEVDPEQLQMMISFDGGRFRAAEVTRMLRDLTTLLRGFVDRPSASVGDLLAAIEADRVAETKDEEDLELAALRKLKQVKRRRPISGEEEAAS